MAGVSRKNNDVFREQFYKASICKYAGRCKFGDACTFAHSEHELQPYPDITKSSICSAWRQRRCPLRARECQFAHGRWELRMSKEYVALSARQLRKPEPGATPHARGKTEPPMRGEDLQVPARQLPVLYPEENQDDAAACSQRSRVQPRSRGATQPGARTPGEPVLQPAGAAGEDAAWRAFCQAACGEAVQHESRYQELFVRLAARNETAADQPPASA